MQLYLLAGQGSEAFAVAAQHHLLEQYLQLAGDRASPADIARASAALEARGDYARAAELHRSLSNAPAAATLYLRVRPCYLHLHHCCRIRSACATCCMGAAGVKP